LVTTRRFPPPWTVEELDACFVVLDRNGQKLAYVYYENEPGRRSAAKLLTKDGARRIAVRLSDLLAALPRLIVNNMARGVYLIGSKLAQRVRAVQIVDCAGKLNYSPAKGLYFAKNRTGIQNAAMAARCGGVVIHE